MREKLQNLKNRATYAAMMTSLVYPMAMQEVFADDIFDSASTLFNKLYKSIAGIATVAAGCMAAVCLFMIFFSKNGRTVEESISWLKRIALAWIGIMLMGSIINYFTGGLGIKKPGNLPNPWK